MQTGAPALLSDLTHAARPAREPKHLGQSTTHRLLLLLLLSPCLGSRVFAQIPANGVTLFGKLQDAGTRDALPYLTLQLVTEKDSTLVAGQLTNDAGAFTFSGLKKGVYVLAAKSVGYRPVRQRVLFGELSPFLDLGALLMVRETQTLGDVVVTAVPME